MQIHNFKLIGILVLFCLLVVSITELDVMNVKVAKSEQLKSLTIDDMKGRYISDLKENLTLFKDGKYHYFKTLRNGDRYEFSGYFKLDEDFSSQDGQLSRVVKFYNFKSPFDPWSNENETLGKQVTSTFNLELNEKGMLAFCNYSGVDGEYTCFRKNKDQG